MTFTVLLPIYQRDDLEKRFSDVVESIYKNTILPDQCVVLIDGSLNNSFKQIVIQNKSKYNYQIFESGKKIGLSEILNIGIKLSRCDWIVRADGDDINFSNRFETLKKYMTNNWDLVGSYVVELDLTNNNSMIKKLPLNFKEIKRYAKFRNPFNHMSVAFRKTSAEKVNCYPHLYLKEDYGLWIKMIMADYNCINIDQVLVEVNAGRDMYIRRGGYQYIKSEYLLYKFKISSNLCNFFEATIYVIIRIFFLIIPNFLKIFLYKKLLRNKNVL